MNRGRARLALLLLVAAGLGCGSRATQPHSLREAFDSNPEYSQPEIREWQFNAIKKYADLHGLEETPPEATRGTEPRENPE